MSRAAAFWTFWSMFSVEVGTSACGQTFYSGLTGQGMMSDATYTNLAKMS